MTILRRNISAVIFVGSVFGGDIFKILNKGNVIDDVIAIFSDKRNSLHFDVLSYYISVTGSGML